MGALWGLATAIAYAITSVTIGQLCKKSHPLAVSLIVTAGTVLFFLAVGCLGGGIHITSQSVEFGLIIGILFAIGNALYYKALSIGPMAMVAVTCSLAPLVPLSFDIATGKAPSSTQIAGFVLIALGILVIARRWHKEGDSRTRTISPLLLVLPASMIFGVNDVLLELTDTASLIGLMLAIQLSKFTATLLLCLPVMGSIRSGPLPIARLLPLGAVYGVAWIALDWSARAGSIDITSALENSYPIFVALLAYWFLGERLSKRQTAGVLAALTGIVLMVTAQSHSHKATPPSTCQKHCPPIGHSIIHRLP